MNPISTIKEKLKKYPHLQVEESAGMITIKPESPDGFEVTFEDGENEYTVYFQGWHEHFDKSEEERALNCFALGLSNSCRIKEYSKNGKPYKWVLESKDNGEWQEDSVMGLLTFNFWNKPEIKYLQNRLIND
jgi:hypothetical protein